MLTVFLMKSPCFFGISVKWMVPILDFSACLGLIFITRTIVTQGQDTAVPLNPQVCAWDGLLLLLQPQEVPFTQTPRVISNPQKHCAGFLYTHTVIKLNKLWELYSQIFTGLISCGQLLHFSELVFLPISWDCQTKSERCLEHKKCSPPSFTSFSSKGSRNSWKLHTSSPAKCTAVMKQNRNKCWL